MIKNFFAVFLLTLILACSQKEKMQIKYYKDISMTTLEGQEELQESELNYPYIKIGELTDKKNITFFLNRRDTIKYEFNKGKDYWVHFYQDNEHDNLYTYYEFITSQHIIQIKYQGDPKKGNYSLVKLGVISDFRKFEYVFPTQDSLKIPPSEVISSFPLGKAFIESETTYQWLNETWKMHQIVNLKSSNKKIVNDTCVDFGINSFAWYLHCYFFVPAYECI